MIFSPEPIREYRDYLTKVDGDLSTLAWLYHMNNGVFMTPGVEEEWTLSIAHSDDDLERFADAFEAFARDVTAARPTDGGRPGGPPLPGRVVDQLRARRDRARPQGDRGAVGADRVLEPRGRSRRSAARAWCR